ncbi:helix-turn-helix transcriptional regulator [Streptomyces rochei]|uniref:Helix-turn-helix transcriptional regulator n=1 Tax=Streptomyces plicatus TaxID=1922 RepID=A0ABW1XUT5_STRPL|nr:MULTISPECIES: YafY family protein [Streptomyces]MDV6289901.1 YafY family protein [Streptomyces sp. UP1A-1]RIH60019.1 YafY family transcriptional regulator [Streptomyces sp. SHP22-7]KYK10527.1 transcriptional regulator [Streptomyces sp. CC71]MBJ6619283.1 YafY family transcriptional regulator [Streptomyces sp. DHE17-7]MBU8549333.1 YafY family transcriptional regulator [Streptomyces sp. Osf17]
MRAARLIKMVLLLQSRPTMTAAELARELEVSERTVTRDAQALSEAGVPVYAERGRAGGYRLIGGYRTRLTGLARGEAEALFLSGVPGALREMGLEDAASAARLKVSAALLPSLRDASRTAAQRFHLDAPNWFREPETPELLPAVADAVWDDRPITARYRRGEDEVVRELEPYGLVLKAGVWYLCARVAAADGGGDGPFRVYRIDRFSAVEPGEARFARDEGFDLPAFWSERAEQFARSILRAEVVVRLSPRGVRQLPYAVDALSAREALDGADAPDADGWVRVTLPVESEEVAHTQLRGLGPEVEVLAPAALRERFAADARRSAALYGDEGPAAT